jgi:2-phosphosulfolactate phosphatase
MYMMMVFAFRIIPSFREVCGSNYIHGEFPEQPFSAFFEKTALHHGISHGIIGVGCWDYRKKREIIIMHIERLSLRGGAYAARGTAVIIDVFRAFTCEPLMFHYGANRIFIEGDIDKCLRLKGDAILVGEQNEVPIEGFDLTNSPSLIMKKGREFFTGKTVIHRTTSGVTGAIAALEKAEEVLLASFVNARATAGYIGRKKPSRVSIVAMGIRSRERAPEDDFCGDYIESLLTGKFYDHIEALRQILAHETAGKFLRGDKPYLPREDPAICIQRDLFDYVIHAERDEPFIEAKKLKAQ